MKDLPVKKKILTGFMVVTKLITVILVLTIATSLSRNNSLQRTNKMNEMQQYSNLLLDNYYLARVEARTVFTTSEAEDEYYLAMGYLETCKEYLDKMEAVSTELDGYMADNIASLRVLFDETIADIVQVGDDSEQANVAIDTMQASGQVMLQTGDDLFILVSDIVQTMAEADPATAGERIENAIVPTQELNAMINDLLYVGQQIVLEQNIDVAPELYAALDAVEMQANSVQEQLVSGEARAAVSVLMEAIADYRAAVEEAEMRVTNAVEVSASATKGFLELNDIVSTGVATVSAEVAEMNEGIVDTSTFTTYILIVVGVVSVILSFVIATVLGQIVTRPLNKMKDVMLQAGQTGNLLFSDEVKSDLRKEAEAKDEIGQSLTAFTYFADHVVSMADHLKRIADKDLTDETTLLSEEDTMGLSLQHMQDSMNEIFSEINRIAAQVAAAANEVATGAQGLAQGSTEQAATVQEVSASVNEINEQMTTSSNTATSSARQVREINTLAQEGNEKMTQLTRSMHDINEASQNIGDVIKVIDNIAFQTNILALNAAVEAAHAGEHGLGFAVVADEVRNLASRSSDAAKETEELISENVAKTEQGMTYTTDTSESLSKIMTGIGETTHSLQLVAEQSEGAMMATGEVTLAIDQVAQVVQQNSATSEESAAASEEMSSQAQVLQELTAEFKLKEVTPLQLSMEDNQEDTGASNNEFADF